MLDLPPELQERLALEPAAFDDLAEAWLEAIPPRECGPAEIEHALGYPWERPARSYLLQDERVTLLEDIGDRDELVRRFARDHHPILAFGSNASPLGLTRKFAHFEDARDREILVLAGDLHDFDVGAAATVTAYGAMPATIFESPGTAVRAAVLYATDAQAVQLTWSELSYFFHPLPGARFEVDEASVEITELYAYVNRFGVFAPDGEPLALAAVPAQHRTAAALDQRELLDRVAELIGVDRHEGVVRRVHESPGDMFRAVRDRVRPLALSAARPGPGGGPGPA